MSQDTIDSERDGYMAGFAKARELAYAIIQALPVDTYMSGKLQVEAALDIKNLDPKEHYTNWYNFGGLWSINEDDTDAW